MYSLLRALKGAYDTILETLTPIDVSARPEWRCTRLED